MEGGGTGGILIQFGFEVFDYPFRLLAIVGIKLSTGTVLNPELIEHSPEALALSLGLVEDVDVMIVEVFDLVVRNGITRSEIEDAILPPELVYTMNEC